MVGGGRCSIGWFPVQSDATPGRSIAKANAAVNGRAASRALFPRSYGARSVRTMVVLVCRPRLHWVPGRTAIWAEGIGLGAVRYGERRPDEEGPDRCSIGIGVDRAGRGHREQTRPQRGPVQRNREE